MATKAKLKKLDRKTNIDEYYFKFDVKYMIFTYI